MTDRESRGPACFEVTRPDKAVVMVRQTLLDSDGHNDWNLYFKVDIAACREAGAVRLQLVEFAPIAGNIVAYVQSENET